MNFTKEVSAAAIIAAGLGVSAFGFVAPAQAACASFWGMGNAAGCTSTFGNTAVALGTTGSATAVGGFGNTAIALSDDATALSAGFFSTAVASGHNSHATAVGIGSLAVDLADKDNLGSGATALGTLNRAINIGNNNSASAISGSIPKVDLQTGNIDIGNNTALNIGEGNRADAVGGFSNGVYNLGNRNWGVAQGVLSNVVQVGDDNHGTLRIPVPHVESLTNSSYEHPPYIEVPTPNVAAGLGAQNLVLGNRNSQNVIGNLSVGTTIGDDNENDVVDPKLLAPTANPLDRFRPSLNFSTIIGSRNAVSSFGSGNFTTVLGNDNDDDGVEVEGDNNVTTVVGNNSHATATGKRNLTSVFGNHSGAHSEGDDKVSTALGDNKHAVNGFNND